MPQALFFYDGRVSETMVFKEASVRESGVTMALWKAQTRHARELSPLDAHFASVARLKSPKCETHTKNHITPLLYSLIRPPPRRAFDAKWTGSSGSTESTKCCQAPRS